MIEPDLTVKQVAKLLNVGETIVYRMIKSGQLEAYRVGTGKRRPSIRITAASVNEFKRRNAILPKKDTSEETDRREVSPAA